MKFTKKLYEGATLYGNDMHVKDIDVLPDATEFKFLGEAPYTGIKYYYLLDINKSFPNVRRIYIDKNVRGIQMNNQNFRMLRKSSQTTTHTKIPAPEC